ncbi:MAG TPA: tail fiber domain-containing protein [Pyrinomonadaceae bacterium]|nr:tail fiber domain-containing protein [Pyrinomonadaceae bacterium]
MFTTSAFAQQTESAAQSPQQPGASATTPTPAAVTASATGVGVRFMASAEAVQLRLELYGANGERIFDSGAQQGSVLDWQPLDVPQGVADGSYLCVLTVKDLQGRASQRIGTLSLQASQASVQRVREQELPDAQKQAVAQSRREQKSVAAADNGLTILREGKQRALTVAAHDGQDGSVTSTKGALSLRTGDVLSGGDREQMRITPEGRVGIGTDKPEATLDVAGTIRARGGIVFDDGTVLNSAQGQAAPGTAAKAAGGTLSAAAAGTGTANKLAKWVDGTGTLGDSALTETGGNVGVGTSTPAYPFHIASAGAGTPTDQGSGTLLVDNTSSQPLGHAAVFKNSNPANSDIVARFQSEYATGVVPAFGAFKFFRRVNTAGNGNGFHFSLNNSANNEKEYGGYAAAIESNTAGAERGALTFLVTSNGAIRQERMRLNSAGNLGLGTSNPAQRLEVVGNIQLAGANNGIIFPDGSKMTTAPLGSGTPSGTTIIGAINDPSTTGTINDNRLSANLGRLNAANAWSGANVFGAGLSANNSLITNVGNPVNAGDATNKVYVDTNFVKFVPGAEQLSIGDANGTAPMINLRGGSTCCSGPGGHTPAWFKVFQNGSFVATGNLGIGVSPMQGKGYRTSWDSYKGAFRSGYADNEWDDNTVGFFSWAGGSNSTAEGLYAFAFGDTNFARSTSSIAFGSGNEVKGAAGFAAGATNRVCDTYGVAFGNKAQSGGPLLNGKCNPDTFVIRGLAAVAIGSNVTADQDYTTAMGRFASNNGFSGTFIWSDGSPQQSADTFRNTANNEFAARATGGFRFRTNLGGTTGCNLPAGSGVFNCTSSRATKENFLLTNGEDVLTRLRKIPVSTWNYTAEGSQVRHIGPMAEDFHAQFGLGTGNTSIGVQDLAGVSLAAVKALDQRTAQLQQRTAEVEQLRAEVQSLRAANAGMEQRLAALEQNMQPARSSQTRTAMTTTRRRR